MLTVRLSQLTESVFQAFDEREKELLAMFEEKEKEMIETQRLVATKFASSESRAVNAQQVSYYSATVF